MAATLSTQTFCFSLEVEVMVSSQYCFSKRAWSVNNILSVLSPTLVKGKGVCWWLVRNLGFLRGELGGFFWVSFQDIPGLS